MVSSGPWKARGMARGRSCTAEFAGEIAREQEIRSRKRVFLKVMGQVSIWLWLLGFKPNLRVENL
jgi:hypothetical protein